MTSQNNSFAHVLGAASDGLTTANIHGSLPYLGVDQSFEPNFRHFDLYMNTLEVPNEDLTQRLARTEEGEERYDMRTFYGSRPRAVPVVVSSIGGGTVVAYVYSRLFGKTLVNMRFAFVKCYLAILLWNNFTKYVGRERHFAKDFKRNQMYAQDELRYLRDTQRVRETLFLKQFVDNPLAEYRVKSWQVADRFA
jgi:hypothetical protein